MAEPNTTQTAEPAPTYSKENPFANSQYTDIADLAELLIKQGYEVDNYVYSEGFTTGTDGVLGNEHVCFRDDANQVYIGRSDVCRDRQMDETYSYVQIDKMDWTSGFPDQIVMQTGDLLGDTAQNWDGCYTLYQGWGGLSGGSCPTINQNYPGADYSTQINFGYVQQTLTNLAAINIALEEAGVEATGYNYSWSVKNIDAGYKDSGNGERTPDTFYVEVVIRDTEGNAVFAKTYDYSQYYKNWTNVSGEETFAAPFDANTIESIQLNVTGKDLGYWAGYYGPEFANPSIKLNYRYTGNPAAEDTTVEDTLLTSQCIADPLYDPACPGYNDAMMAQIASTNTIDDVNTGAVASVQTTTNDGSTGTFDDTTGTTEQLADTTGAVIDDGSDTGSDNGMSDPVAEATGEPDPVQEAVAEATPDPVQEATATETAVAEAAGETKSAGTGLNATQLSALDAANNVANSAVSSSTDVAQASAGIGLSESGGVSSTLTSVDPTGSTSADGGVNGGSNFEFGSNSSGGQSFASGSDNGQSQNGSTDSNNGSQSNDSFGTTDFASTGQTAQDNNPLADGSAVETNDITGEQDLATSNEALTQLAMLNDPTNPVNQIINDITSALITQAVADAEETAEESAEASVESQNAQEDALVAEALAGSDDEDAQAALLGYNPNFRAYQQPQMPGGDIYNDQGVYLDQKTYDNPRAGLFNGASDALHREMVRSQYEN